MVTENSWRTKEKMIAFVIKLDADEVVFVFAGGKRAVDGGREASWLLMEYQRDWSLLKWMDLVKQNGVQPDRQELCREVEKRFTPYTTKKWRGGEMKSKLVVCNREGFAHKMPRKDQDDGLDEEKSQRIFRVTRVGCKARIRLYMKNGPLLIDRFHEGHNHELISLKDREFQKLSRNITDYHKMIIVSNSRPKIGATKTYRICKEQVNGYENIGASLNDFKNFHRDVKCFIHERDDTYAIRGQWVMAHCRDLRMALIMRTTQRSESENSFFKRFEHNSGTLVEFWMSFESAMDQQRHTQKQLDNMDKHPSATASTHLALEIHAAKVYTYSAFQKFKQEAIFSIDTCRTGGFTERGELEVITVKDSTRKKNFEVKYSQALSDDTASGIKTIPEDYVLNRWMKEYLRFKIFNTDGEGTENMQVIDEKQIAMSIMWSEVHEAVGLLRDKGIADVDNFSAVIRSFKQSLSPLGEVLNKNQQMEKFLNCTACEVVTILPPKNSKNKGTGKRLVSAKTKAIVLARKPKRKCKNCKRMTNHDKRNCPNPFSAHTPLCEGSSEPEEDEGEEEEELESEQE
ncbi:uncharacterized protein LOC141630138 [Silene latifolia]|uniref:uncharacterized protein LOC141630138 n=1 Tax=Silene latifolia TaxID=37657 RepID=UPI003D77D067